MKVLFFLGELGTGGAERQYVQLAQGLARRGHSVTFLTVYPGGQQWEQLEESTSSVELQSLFPNKGSYPLRSLIHFLGSIWKIRREASAHDVLYSGLHLPNLISCLATLGKRHPRLIWGIRASDMKLNSRRALPRRACALLSPCADMLISNSYSGLQYHQDLGYRTSDTRVIANGIDTKQYQYSEVERERVRREFQFADDEQVLIVVGRIDPMKGHHVFLKAFAQLAEKNPLARAIIVGTGPRQRCESLRELSVSLGLERRVQWTGARSDLAALYSGADLFCLSSSYGEGFPNVLGEAMSCELPAVVTDVGDAARIIGNPGRVVPTDEPEALAAALQKALVELSGRAAENRKRIVECYAVEAITEATEAALRSTTEV